MVVLAEYLGFIKLAYVCVLLSQVKKCTFLYNGISSKRCHFTPWQTSSFQCHLDFFGKYSAMLQLLHKLRLFVQISTSVYSQVLVQLCERNCQSFKMVARGFKPRFSSLRVQHSNRYTTMPLFVERLNCHNIRPSSLYLCI